MASRLHQIENNGYLISKGNNWLAAMIDVPASSVNEPTDYKSTVKIKNTNTIVNWGTDNKLPFQIIDDVKRTTVLGAGIRQKIKVHYGRGPIAFTEEIDEQGKIKVVPTQDAVLLEFWKRNRIPQFLLAQVTDYEFFSISFVEYILNAAGTEIVSVHHKGAPFIRMTVKELKDAEWRSLFAVYSKYWLKGNPTDKNAVEINFIEPDLPADLVLEFCKKNKIKKFIRPIIGYMPATDYYPEAFWHAARKSGWIEIANLIPLVKKAIIQNSMTLKYLVRIPLDYFEKKYPSSKLSPKEREALIEEDLEALDSFLADFKNTGKSLTTYYDTDKVTRQKTGNWEIEVIDNNIKEGVLNLDSAAANSEILFSVGIDPSLIGSGMPGKELGAKSGSDKRESYNVAITNAMTDRMMTLETLEFVRDFNKWNSLLKFAYQDNILTTLDQNPTGIQKQSV